jgi:hypothetical protein
MSPLIAPARMDNSWDHRPANRAFSQVLAWRPATEHKPLAQLIHGGIGTPNSTTPTIVYGGVSDSRSRRRTADRSETVPKNFVPTHVHDRHLPALEMVTLKSRPAMIRFIVKYLR